jgi:4-amino-4-deoxy-L-arabinose transferase-like glycosyltransferase
MKNIHGFLTQRTSWFILFTLVLGVLLRLYFSGIAEREITWDSSWYYSAAVSMAKGVPAADCCNHGGGYPLTLSPILRVFGLQNTDSIRIFQILLDFATGILLAVVGWKVFGKKAGLAILFVYETNLLSPPYTGYILSELLSMAIIALLLYIVSRKSYGTRSALWMMTGMILGYLYFTKPAFFWYVPFLLVVFALFVIQGLIRKFKFIVVCGVGVFLVSLLPLLMNYTVLRQVRVTPPGVTTWGALYQAWFEGISPEIAVDYREHDPRWVDVQNEYWYSGYKNIPVFDKKYKKLYLEKIQKELPSYIPIVVRNMIFLWDKRHLFISPSPYHPADVWPMRILNIIYFSFGAIGIVSYLRKKTKNIPVVVYSLSVFVFMTLVFPLVTNMTRHSLPFYPLLLFWAGVSLGEIIMRKSI